MEHNADVYPQPCLISPARVPAPKKAAVSLLQNGFIARRFSLDWLIAS